MGDTKMARRPHLSLIVLLGFAILFSIYTLSGPSASFADLSSTGLRPEKPNSHYISGGILTGGSIAPKLGNATAK